MVLRFNLGTILKNYNRVFLIKASKAFTAPIFTSRSLTSAGRIDVIVRSIISALTPVHRYETAIVAILEGPPNPPLLLVVAGNEVEDIPLSEREMGEIILKVLNGNKINGFYLAKISFKKIILQIISILRGKVLYMHEEGKDFRYMKEFKVFVLGDHLGIDKDTEVFMENLGIPKASLGPLPYFTSHCITLIHEELDRMNDD